MGQIKKANEISKIQEACRITDRIFAKARRYIILKIATSSLHSSSQLQKLYSITEKELADFMYQQIASYECKPSFPVIVAAWSNAAHPHWKPSNAKLKGFVVIDFGVIYQKYMSDMTRTIFVWQPTKDERKLYYRVLAAQKASINYIHSWVYAKDAHRVATEMLWSYKKYFIHSLGHGLWTKIHELPRISPKGKKILQKNMCITLEPGVYIPWKCGIRIEDTSLVTHNECVQMTHSVKKLICIT